MMVNDKTNWKASFLRTAAPLTARARLQRSFRVAVSADDDTIVLRFEWSGGPARLIELRDNETDIYVADPIGPWVYQASPDTDHIIEWHLFAPGRTLTNLKAIATLNGPSEKTLATAESSEGGWISGGDLR